MALRIFALLAMKTVSFWDSIDLCET